MHEWKVGDHVQISDQLHPRYGQIGTVERLGEQGGLWIRHKDDEVIYHPWGYDILRWLPEDEKK